MRTIAIAAGALLASIAATASAQVYYERNYTYDPYPGARTEWRGAGDECWNPRAGHFEAVRPGEIQNDLDFSRCRPIGIRYDERRYGERRYDGRVPRDRDPIQECWNPRAGHFEQVRPSEYQGDLDTSRCRMRY